MAMNTSVSPIEYEEIAAFVERHLSQLDSDCDGRLSSKEISKAICKHDWSGRDGLIVAFLHRCYANLLKTDLIFKRNDRAQLDAVLKDGINADSIRQISKLLEERDDQTRSKLVQTPMWAHKLFAICSLVEFDADQDQNLSRKELENALAKPDVHPTMKKTMDYMLQNFDTICGGDGLLSYGEAWAHFSSEELEAAFLAKAAEQVLRVLEKRTKSTERALFPTDDCIQPQAIQQGFVQDCLFLAMVASTAALNPTVIRQCIKPLGGSPARYEVHFPAAPKETFVVTQPSDAELSMYCSATDYGIWPAILESACGAYTLKSPLRRLAWVRPWNWRPLFGAPEQSRNASYGGWNLFGPVTREVVHHHKLEEFAAMLRDQVSSGKPAAVAHVWWFDTKEVKLRPNHAYAVVGYDEQTDSIRVYNPWGSNSQDAGKETNGFIDLTMQEAFETLSVVYRVKP